MLFNGTKVNVTFQYIEGYPLTKQLILDYLAVVGRMYQTADMLLFTAPRIGGGFLEHGYKTPQFVYESYYWFGAILCVPSTSRPIQGLSYFGYNGFVVPSSGVTMDVYSRDTPECYWFYVCRA